MRPIVIWNVLHSARLLTDVCRLFREHGVEGIELDRERIAKYVRESLMTVTALSPVIGYDKAAEIAHRAMQHNLTLREAAVEGGFISSEDFDRIVDPAKMVGDPRADLGMKE
jgi:fumarate hydratase class II